MPIFSFAFASVFVLLETLKILWWKNNFSSVGWWVGGLVRNAARRCAGRVSIIQSNILSDQQIGQAACTTAAPLLDINMANSAAAGWPPEPRTVN